MTEILAHRELNRRAALALQDCRPTGRWRGLPLRFSYNRKSARWAVEPVRVLVAGRAVMFFCGVLIGLCSYYCW